MRWAKIELAPLVDEFPVVRKLFLQEIPRALRSSPEEAWFLIELMGGYVFSDPEFSDLCHQMIRLPSTLENHSAKGRLAQALLKQSPQNKAALQVMKELVEFELRASRENEFDAAYTFEWASQQLERDPELNHAIERGVSDLIRSLERPSRPGPNVAVRNAFALYLKYLNVSGFSETKARRFLKSAPEIREYMLAEIIKLSDSLPASAQSIVEDHIRELTANRISHFYAHGEKVDDLGLQIALRDLQSSDDILFSNAADILKAAAIESPRVLDPLKTAALKSRYPAIRKRAIKELKDFDPSLPEAQTSRQGQSSNIVSERAAEQRRLLFDANPPVGWRLVAQSFDVSYHGDPFLFNQEVNGQTRQAAEAGWEVRGRALEGAARSLQTSGMLTHPLAWLESEYQKRKKEVRGAVYDGPLSPAQIRQIETQATARMRSTYPHLSGDALTQGLHGVQYQQIKMELEWNTKREQKRNFALNSIEDSNQWRKETAKSLEEQLRRSLRAIIRAGQGAVMADPEDENKGGGAFRVAEQDLKSLKVISDDSHTGVELSGREVSLDFLGHSLEGLNGMIGESCNAETTREIAALTLGAQDATLNNVAEEVYLGRVFHHWMKQFRQARSILNEGSLDRVGQQVRRKAANEERALNKQLVPDGPTRVLASLLWRPVEKDPNYWRDREAAAVTRAATEPWKVIITAGEGDGLTQAGIDHRSAGLEPVHTSISSPPGASKRSAPRNKEISDEMRRSVYYRLQRAKNEVEMPSRFSRGFEEDFLDVNRLRPMEGVPFESDGADFTLYTEHVQRVAETGFVSIPQPEESKKAFRLESLQVFSSSGERLYPERDYQIVRESRTAGAAIQLLNSRVASVRFAAGFAEDEAKAAIESPRVSAERISKINKKLEEAGFQKLAEEIAALLRNSAGEPGVRITDLGSVFRSNGIYATSFQKDLGTKQQSVPEDNPFREFSRFLNPGGILCAQCDGANEFFAKFLSLVVDPASGIRVETRGRWLRKLGAGVITEAGAHLVTVVWIPGQDLPLEVDVTPPGHDFADDNGPWNREGVPEWVGKTKDQVSQPAPLPRALDSRARNYELVGSFENQETRTGIADARSKLRAALHSADKAGTRPLAGRPDSTEPIVRLSELAAVAVETLAPSADLEAARARLRTISPWFHDKALVSRTEILNAVAGYSDVVREQLARFLRVRPSGDFAHYRTADIAKPLGELMQQLSDLNQESSDCGFAWLKAN